MSIQIATSWAIAALLLSLRIGPVFVLAPPLSQVRIPMRVRACVVLALSACFADTAPRLTSYAHADLLISAASEFALGLAIALAFQAAFASLSFAGRVLDVQAGYGLAMVIDPGSRGQAPLFGTILTLLAGVIFFAAGGHRDLLQLIVSLIHSMPPGNVHLLTSPQTFIGYFGAVMTVGLASTGSAVICLFMIDLTIAFLSRALPQMNALMLGLQVKTIVTLVVTAMSMGLVVPIVLKLLNMALRFVPSLD
jgi:flagellar biosynthetic protein FliR